MNTSLQCSHHDLVFTTKIVAKVMNGSCDPLALSQPSQFRATKLASNQNQHRCAVSDPAKFWETLMLNFVGADVRFQDVTRAETTVVNGTLKEVVVNPRLRARDSDPSTRATSPANWTLLSVHDCDAPSEKLSDDCKIGVVMLRRR